MQHILPGSDYSNSGIDYLKKNGIWIDKFWFGIEVSYRIWIDQMELSGIWIDKMELTPCLTINALKCWYFILETK